MSACIQDLKAMLGEERVVTDEAVLASVRRLQPQL